MEKLEQLYEGKAKKVYATDDPALCIVSYKDDATAFNGEKRGTILGKGVKMCIRDRGYCPVKQPLQKPIVLLSASLSR